MAVTLWALAVLALLGIAVVVVASLGEQQAAQRQHRQEVRRLEVLEAQPWKVVDPQPVWPERVVVPRAYAQMLWEHERAVELYKSMVDELYDYGEDVVRRSRPQP